LLSATSKRDQLSDVRVFSKADDLMIRVMDKLEGNRRVLRTEPFAFSFRDALNAGTDFKLEFEFMGYYGEPNLDIIYGYHDEANAQSLYLLEYNPRSGEWTTSKQSDITASGDVNDIIDLTDDTTILASETSGVAA
jgi:hypothetical protein